MTAGPTWRGRWAARAGAALVVLASSAVHAQGAAELDRLKALTTLLGQADACNVDASTGVERVRVWVNRTWPQGSKDQAGAQQVWMKNTQDAARAQRRNASGKSCEQVARDVAATKWP